MDRLRAWIDELAEVPAEDDKQAGEAPERGFDVLRGALAATR